MGREGSSHMKKKTETELKWVINEINSNAVLDSVYKACIKMGADAFTQLKISDVPALPYSVKTINPISKNTVISINGMKIEGYAIKRLGAFK